MSNNFEKINDKEKKENNTRGPLSQEEAEELRRLRRIQIENRGPLSFEEIEKLRILNEREQKFGRINEKISQAPLSQTEFQRYLELTRKQTAGKPEEWTDEDRKELLRLQERIKRFGIEK